MARSFPLKTAFDFLRDAAHSGASLYHELAVSAYQLVPYAQTHWRKRQARQDLRADLEAGYPLSAALRGESRLA